jgi:hypothetical protein
MQHPEEGIIHAWLDGGLPASEAAAIESHVASCAECQESVAEARGLIAAASRIVGHLDVVPGNVIPAQPAKPKRSWIFGAWPAAIAATLVVGIGFLANRKSASEIGIGDTAPPPAAPTALAESVRSDSANASKMEAQRQPAPTIQADRVARLDADSVSVPALPGLGAATPTSRVAIAPPPPVANSAADVSAPERQSRMKLDAVVVTGTVGTAASGRAAVAAAPPAIADARRAMAPSPAPAKAIGAVVGESASLAVVPDSVFVGCYEATSLAAENPATSAAAATKGAARTAAGRAVAVPQNQFSMVDRFQRFALSDEPAPTSGLFTVREVDASGNIGLKIPGAGWSVRGDRAVVIDSDGRIVANVSKTDSTVQAVYSRGGTARVVFCRK